MFFRKKDEDKIKGAIIGAIVGDASGVPFEFMKSEDIDIKKINKIQNGGKWQQPIGSWSDDSSMVLCTMESLCKGYNYQDIGDTFVKWAYEGYLTPFGITYDIGSTVSASLRKIRKKDYSGIDDEDKCGNGSLMRIMPIVFYIDKHPEINKYQMIKEVSSLTHSNMLCVIGCAIYVELALNLLTGQDKEDAYKNMQESITTEYKDYKLELDKFAKILNRNICDINFSELSGTGYILDSLESSLYSFMTTNNYKKSIETAISIGIDTDTIACICGGLSGLYYGFDNIPSKWVKLLIKKDDILNRCKTFKETL